MKPANVKKLNDALDALRCAGSRLGLWNEPRFWPKGMVGEAYDYLLQVTPLVASVVEDENEGSGEELLETCKMLFLALMNETAVEVQSGVKRRAMDVIAKAEDRQ